MREPDWDALADLQFLLYNRITGALNEAVSSMELSDMPEAQDKPPGYWKNRATSKVSNVLNLFNAWTYLIRYKQGLPIPERAIRPFRANELLRWVGVQLQLNPIPQLKSNPLLHANQETLQEAILLLHSAAYTQGSGVRMEVEASKLGAWFKVRFSRSRPLPNTLDELLDSFGDHWRAQDTVFELTTARDFIALNNAELVLLTTPMHGEFTFFVRAAGRKVAVPASDVPTWPSKTRQLDPAAVAAYEAQIAARGVKPAAVVDVKADQPAADKTPAAPGEKAAPPATPEVAPAFKADTAPAAKADTAPEGAPEKHATESDATPVMKPEQAEKLVPQPAAPSKPAVDVLRPLPPPLSELERQAAIREAKSEDPGTATGEDTAQEAEHKDTDTAQAQTVSAPEAPAAPEKPAEGAAPAQETPPAPPESGAEAADAPKIVSVKLPEPAPPPTLLKRLQPASGESAPAQEPPTPPDARTTPTDAPAPGTESGEHSTPPAAQEKPNDESADKAANGSADSPATPSTDTPPANTRKDTP